MQKHILFSIIVILFLAAFSLSLVSTPALAVTPPTNTPAPTPTPTQIVIAEEETLKEAGICKFISIDNTASIGNPITATGKGITAYLRLEANHTYTKLPVIPGSQTLTADGDWQAQYYTIDPTTSQPLVAPGTYTVACFGEGGTANANNQTITITR